jgi:tetratricopeptide (TPR) repeat protein
MPDIKRLKEQAQLFYQKGEWEKSRRAYEQLTLLEPENPEYVLTLANIYRELGDERKALEQYEIVMRIGEKANDIPRSIAAAKRILSIDKGRIELYNKAGEFYASLKLKSGAVREWLRYSDQMKIRSDFVAMAGIYRKIAGLLPENKALADLISKIDQLVGRMAADNSEDTPDPADIVPYRRLLDVALKMGNAKKILETQLTYARVLQKRGFQRKAKAVYQKILERDPNNEEALSRILSAGGDSQADQGQLREELFLYGKDFQEAVWSNISESYETYYDIGMLYREAGLKDDAIADYQLSIKGGNRQLKGFEMLAISFLEQGDYGLASEVLNQGISVKKFLDNEYVGLHYNLGLAQEQLGNWEKALDEYEQVYILDINYKDVAVRMRQVMERSKASPVPAPAAPPREQAVVVPTLKETAIPACLPAEKEASVSAAPQPSEMEIAPEELGEPEDASLVEYDLAEQYQDLVQSADASQESMVDQASVLSGGEEAETEYGDDTVEVVLDAQPPQPARPSAAPAPEPPVKKPPAEDVYVGEKEQGISFL